MHNNNVQVFSFPKIVNGQLVFRSISEAAGITDLKRRVLTVILFEDPKE